MIRKATEKDMDAVAALATLLWPDHAVEELAAEYAPLLRDDDCAVFLASDDVRDAGFAQVQLRRDYVELHEQCTALQQELCQLRQQMTVDQ